jgi:crooked neck
MEMREKQVNHARNIWDRATLILPRVAAFWQKYTYMEEMLGNVVNARQIFERWMEWHPEETAWYSYIKFEMRYTEVENARNLYERFVRCHGEVKHWCKFAKFEMHSGHAENSRAVYERAVEYFGVENMSEDLMLAFAWFEESQKEFDRARGIYKLALDKLGKARAEKIFVAYTQYEKKYGDRSKVEGVIVDKRRFMYEAEVKSDPTNYDAWFDYIRLCEEDVDADGRPTDVEKTRDTYERAIAQTPPANEKRLWRRYIYLWINYAVWEELTNRDPEKTRDVYKQCLATIPNSEFTFAKIWLLFAQFEIRQKDVTAARKILGRSIGMCPKAKLFRGYIQLEIHMQEFDRARTLYTKYLEFNASNVQTWADFAELETLLEDPERARAIYELGVEHPLLDMPEVLWKKYIDFETDLGEFDRARELFNRLLAKAKHVKVYIAFAEYEAAIESDDNVEQARLVYEEADKEVRKGGDKAQRLLLLESRLAFEEDVGDADFIGKVQAKMPRKVKRRREVFDDAGNSEGWEEYYDYIFPDEQAAAPNLKLLEKAKMWKAMQEAKMAAVEAEFAAEEDDAGEGMDVGGAAAPAADDDVADFIPSATFDGSRSGYVFKAGAAGNGYYRD